MIRKTKEFFLLKRKVLLGIALVAMFSCLTVVQVQSYLVIDDPPGGLPTDTDGDGLSDSSEDYVYHTNKYKVDTDGDGLSDYAEVITYHTNPLKVDTDGDGLKDKDEITYGYNPKVAEASNMFVYNSHVYCGVAFLAWVEDYSTRQNWYDICTVGDCEALDGSTGSSYNYKTPLQDSGYLVFTVADFTISSFFDGFQKALCFADYFNTRLFVVSHAHGYFFGGFTTHNEWEKIDVTTFATHLFNPLLLTSTRLNSLGLGFMIGKLDGVVPEIVYYIASCFALGGYGEIIPSLALINLFMTYGLKGAILGVIGVIAKFSDVSNFRTNFLLNGQALWPAYWDACWTILCAAVPWGGFNANTYTLVEI